MKKIDKTFFIVLFIIIVSLPTAMINSEQIHASFLGMKTAIQGEANKKPVVNLSKNNSDYKIYNKNGVYFKYPGYWTYDEINKLFSLYKKEYLTRWDDGIIFYISDNSLENELKYQKNNEGYKNQENEKIANKKAYSLSDIKADYWNYMLLVEKNSTHTYVFTFYTDKDLKNKNTKLFQQIINSLKLE